MKRLLATVVTAALLLAFAAGCGGSGEKGKNSGKDDRPKSAKDKDS
jgi:hypothetical protein